MKIAIVAPRFPPEGAVGGIEIATQNISKGLAQKGNDIFIITSGVKSFVKNLDRNIKLCRLSSLRIKILDSLIFWFKIYLALRKINPDVIHCQTIQMGLPCFWFKKIYKKPYIVWCHGFDVYFPWKFKKIISKIVLDSAGAIVALTNDMKNELRKTCPKDIIIIPNGVGLRDFEGFSKQAIRDKLKISFNEKIVLFVGGLRKVKGIEYLIEAFGNINQENPEAVLFLIGDGEERKNLENIVERKGLEKNVRWVGKITSQETYEYMLASDIFVLPSLSEGFPLVILEAMASGLPIIATKVRGLSEILHDGENGFLVDPKKSNQIAEKILLLLENGELRQKISNNNKARAKEYSWENIIKKIEEIYLKVVKSNIK